MRAVRLEAVDRLFGRDTEPRPPESGEVLVRVRACGVCGTDRHILHGHYAARLPVVLGHEFAGTISAVGGSSRFTLGQAVAVDPNIACGHCARCADGDMCLCPDRVALGVDLDGGLAEFVTVPETQLFVVPDQLALELAALCEPLACCLHALDLAHVAPGMSVAVVGGGVIGLMITQLARLAGATSVLLATRQPSRRQLAERLGASWTVDPAGDLVAKVRAGGAAPNGLDVVFECVGSGATFEQCLALARRGGTVVVVGVAPEHEMASISPFDIFARELRIVGSYLNPRTHSRAVSLAASGRLDLDALVTRRAALEDIPGILNSPPAAGEVKVLAIA